MDEFDHWLPLFQSLENHFQNPQVVDHQIQSCRIFHGRAGLFPQLMWCVVDDFCPTVLVTLFKAPPPGFMDHLVSEIKRKWLATKNCPWLNLAVQARYEQHSPVHWLIGSEPESAFALREGMRFTIRFDRQNIGFFLDMEPGRRWLQRVAKGAKVLNLFAFTCAFSPIAIAAGAVQVTNVDMSRSALTEGRQNHKLNQVNTSNVQFLPLDILKSWSRIAKYGPYDVVIVDPPSFQKGSFIAVRDYAKIIRRLNQLTNPGANVLLCLNAPEINSHFLLELMAEHGENWNFIERLALPDVFRDVDHERQLKLLHFQRGS